jgi:hypothetical protein
MTIILWYVITSYQSSGRDFCANFEAAENFDMLNTIHISEMQGVTFKGT